MKAASLILTAILVGVSLASADDEPAQKRILEFTICEPIEESFAIETIFTDAGERKPILIRQYRPIPDRLEAENPVLDMFKLELVETWEPDVRVIESASESTVNRLPLKSGEWRDQFERVKKLWARGNFTEKRGGELCVARIEQDPVAD